MDCVSDQSQARLRRATREYERLRDVRKEVAAAIIAERLEGTTIEEIARMSPYRQTHVNRILKAAGLTEDRPAKAAADSLADA